MSEGKDYQQKTNFAVYAVWAALISVASLLPSIPIVGTGGTFSLKAVILPLAGILFGPGAGAVICGVGGFIGQLLAPHTAWMGIVTFITGIFTGTVAGMISRGRWKLPLLVLALFSGLWWLHPIGREAWIYPLVFYSMGAVTMLVGGLFARKWLLSSKNSLRGLAIWLSSFSGFVMAAGYANYVGGLNMLELPAQTWLGLMFISPVERTIFSLGAVLVGIPLLIGLPKIGLYVGPQNEEKES